MGEEDGAWDEVLDHDGMREEARRVAYQMLAEGARLREDRDHWLIQVFDERGDAIFKISLADAVRSETVRAAITPSA